MNYLIVGGAGFIGSHMATRLLAAPDTRRAVIFDNFSSGTHAHLQPIAADPRLEVCTGDIKDLEALTTSMRGCNSVFHFAANPDIAKAVTKPDIDFWEGTYLTQNVLEAMRLTNTQQLFYTSGSGVYGENAGVAFTENYGPCLPISTYGASKLACEALICAYCHMFGLRGLAFRFANVVGPRQTHGVGYDFVRRLTSDPTWLRILGDGSQSKSYIHVNDVIDAMLLAGMRTQQGYDLFNVATDDYITVKEIADLALEVCHLSTQSVRYEYSGGDRGWKGDVPIVRFNTAKIKALGWKAHRTSRIAILDSMTAMRNEITHA